MNLSEFQTTLIRLLNARTSQGESVCIENFQRNNAVEKRGIILRDERCEEYCVSPVVYPEDLYRIYQDGYPMDRLADEVWRVLHMPAPTDTEKLFVTDRTFALSHAVLRLIGKKQNQTYLEKVLYRDFLDLAVTIGIVLEKPDGSQAMTVLTKEMLEELDIPENVIFREAAANSPLILGDCLKDMSRMLLELKAHTGEDPAAAEGDGEDTGNDRIVTENGQTVTENCRTGTEARIPLYVLTNQVSHYGASAMLYSGKIRELANRIGMDLLILPSSVHELILMPDRGNDSAKEVREFVTGINESVLRPEDILSDSVYRYSREKDCIEIAAADEKA